MSFHWAVNRSFHVSVAVVGGLFALSACGIVERSPNGAGGEDSVGECAPGDLRLSEQECPASPAGMGGTGAVLERAVEECVDSAWASTSQCAAPAECEDGSVVPTGQLCDEFFFYNHELQRCSGELLQATFCRCGAPAPTNEDIGGSYVREQADADQHADTTFSWMLYFSRDGGSVTGLDHLKCVQEIYGDGEPFPALDSLVGVTLFSLTAPDASGFPRLQFVSMLNVAVESESLLGLESLREVRHELVINSDSLRSLDGLEGLRYLGRLDFWRAENLVDISALAGVEMLGELDLYFPPSIQDLTGLHNVRTIEGDMAIDIPNEEQLHVFDALEEVGGDVHLRVPADLRCIAGNEFLLKEIGGALTINSDEEFSQRDCE